LPKDEVKRLLRELRETNDPAIRTALIEAHLGLVEYLARRFAGRGEPLDDLIQVATIGLVKAVDRFDPGREVEFSTYATPTIVGELKRHFRDKGWAVRVPRRLQELNLRLGSVVGKLSQDLQRSPTVAEIAARADLDEEQVVTGLRARRALAPPTGGDRDLLEAHGGYEDAIEQVERRLDLGLRLRALDHRSQVVVALRFGLELSQAEIAERLGISQMHVSRLLRGALERVWGDGAEP
jgi:RNA polymerase sigma-B factor